MLGSIISLTATHSLYDHRQVLSPLWAQFVHSQNEHKRYSWKLSDITGIWENNWQTMCHVHFYSWTRQYTVQLFWVVLKNHPALMSTSIMLPRFSQNFKMELQFCTPSKKTYATKNVSTPVWIDQIEVQGCSHNGMRQKSPDFGVSMLSYEPGWFWVSHTDCLNLNCFFKMG